MTLNVDSGAHARGLTADPSSRLTAQNAHIIINDGGFDSSSGSGVVLEIITGILDYILEHEMAHFLFRRTDQPPYDVPPLLPGQEHVPATFSHLLRVAVPAILSLPSGETQETKNRLTSGSWKNP